MQQLDFVALLAEFDSHQIAHRKHTNPAFAINHRKMTRADQFHSLQRLVRSFITVDDRAQFAQLIGYSVSGASELDYIEDRIIDEANEAARALSIVEPVASEGEEGQVGA